MSHNRTTRLVIIALLIAALACSLPSASGPDATTPADSPPSEASPPAPTSAPPEGAYAPVFASYNKPSVTLPSTFSSYSLPIDLSTVAGVEDFELSPEQLALLSQNGFVVAAPEPGEYRVQLYSNGELLREARLHLIPVKPRQRPRPRELEPPPE